MHPRTLPHGEALLLLAEVAGDPLSRTFAHLQSWPMRLGVWLSMRTVTSLTGTAEGVLPTPIEERPRHAPAEVDAAAAALRRFTAIPS